MKYVTTISALQPSRSPASVSAVCINDSHLLTGSWRPRESWRM